MRLKLKEEPKEWRKAGLSLAVGLTILSSLLRWRHVLTKGIWLAALAGLLLVALAAWTHPRWFRGWYRVTTRLAFWIGRCVGLVAMVLAFYLIFTPASLVLRLLKKDTLKLKRDPKAASYWTDAKENTPLERLF